VAQCKLNNKFLEYDEVFAYKFIGKEKQLDLSMRHRDIDCRLI
jgi:hypothetical protein